MRQAGAWCATWFTETRITVTIAVLVVLAILAAAILICSGLYEVSRLNADCTCAWFEQHIRNYGLIEVAFVGIVLAVWRSRIAERQVTAQCEATTQSDEQHRRSLAQTRLFQAVELLKDDASEAVKIAGVIILARMPHDDDNPHKGDALRVLEEFVLSRSSAAEAGDNVDPLVQAAVRTLTEKKLPDGLTLDLHRGNQLHAHLIYANLIGAHLEGAKLVGARLNGAHLHETHLERAMLSRARLNKACLLRARLTESDLSYADLEEADLSHAHLNGANLNGANFREAEGLSQEQLDTACQHPDGGPPMNLPDGLIWYREAAKARWRKLHGPQVHG